MEEMKTLEFFVPGPLYRKPTLMNSAKLEELSRDSRNTYDEVDVDRVFIEYYCPILGYREWVFPIFHGDTVLGALFVGQILQEGEMAKKTQETFFETAKKSKGGENHEIYQKLEQFFVDYNKDKAHICKKLNYKKFKKKILSADDDIDPILTFSNDEKTPSIVNMTLSKENYLKKIAEACKQARFIENDLENRMQEKRRNFFWEKLGDITKKFLDQIVISNPIRPNQLKASRANLYVAVQEIKDAFGFEEAYLFGYDTSSIVRDTRRWLIQPGGGVKKDDLYYDYDGISIDPKSFSSATNLDDGKEHLIDGLHKYKMVGDRLVHSESPCTENCITVVYANMVLVFRVVDLNIHKKNYKLLFNVIKERFLQIYSAGEMVTNNFFNEHHLGTLRMYKHETSHIAERANDRGESAEGKFREMTRRQMENFYKDMKSTIGLISHMPTNIELILGTYKKESMVISEEPISIFKEVLYKWENMFEKKLKSRNLTIKVPAVFKLDEKRPYKIKTNMNLFDLLVYNLVDNAVKHAYRGSVIHIDCKRPNDSSFDFLLTVTNIGPYIESGNIPYELYSRGEQHNSDRIGGDGIGLYTVDKISNLLGLTKNHTCEELYPYNVPLVSWYLNDGLFQGNSRDSSILTRLRDDWSNLEQILDGRMQYLHETKGIHECSGWKDIIFQNKSNPIAWDDNLSTEYLLKRITAKTHVITFEIGIPVSKENWIL